MPGVGNENVQNLRSVLVDPVVDGSDTGQVCNSCHDCRFVEALQVGRWVACCVAVGWRPESFSLFWDAGGKRDITGTPVTSFMLRVMFMS